MNLRNIIAAMLILPLGAVSTSGKSYDKVGLMENPVSIESVKDIGGFVGDRMEVNRHYLTEFPIERYIDFIVDRQHTAWDWTRAEQHGKWFESAYLTAIQREDPALLTKAEEQLLKMLASQEPEGYVGATARSYRSSERPIRGMDPYELYFVFHALMTIHEQTGSEQSLEAVKKLADYFVANFGPGKHEFWPSDLRYPENVHQQLSGTSDFAGHSVHYSWEGTMLCDPMARLYEITGDKRYLDWTQWVVSNIDRWSGWDAFSRLDQVADGTLGVDQLQPYVHSHTFHMNFMGFLRLYRITGDQSLLRKVMGAWEDIASRQMYITGGVSVAEHYESDYIKPLTGNIVETCASMSWMQLTQMLLEITGDTKYADAIERLMLNHVFAAQDCEGGVCRYHTAPNGSKPDGRAGFFHGPDCCTASGHRIISLLPTFLYAQKGNDFYINQYLDSRYASKDKDGLSFTIQGNFPENETVTLSMTQDKPQRKTLNLRMPSWCSNPQVMVNGEEVEGVECGKYLTIDRKWSKGDRITINFPMEEHWIVRQNHADYQMSFLPGGEIMFTEKPSQTAPAAFMRGPIVYALDMVWNKHICNDDADIMGDFKIDTSITPVKVEKVADCTMGPWYKTHALYKGSKTEVVLTPFTNAGQWFRPGEAEPNSDATAFTYGIWLNPIQVNTMADVAK